MVMLEGKLTRIIFPSLLNIVVRNSLVFVLEEKLTCVRFYSLCNIFDGKVVVTIAMLTWVSFHSHVMLLL